MIAFLLEMTLQSNAILLDARGLEQRDCGKLKRVRGCSICAVSFAVDQRVATLTATVEETSALSQCFDKRLRTNNPGCMREQLQTGMVQHAHQAQRQPGYLHAFVKP